MPITIPLVAADGATSTVTIGDPPVTTGVPITIGDTTVETTVDNGNGNLLAAQQATLAQAATIQSLSFYVVTASGGLRLGLYDATGAGGNPGKLLAATPAFTPVAGWNTVNVVTPVSLLAGNYWLAYLPQSNTLSFPVLRGSYGNVNKAFTYAALPTTFPASPAAGPGHWSFYATLLGGPPPLQPPVVAPANFSNANGWGLNALIGVVVATNNPTSFQISNNPNNYFTIDNVGNLKTSATIAVPNAIYNIGIAATNSAGQGAFAPFVITQGPPPADSIAPTVPTGLIGARA